MSPCRPFLEEPAGDHSARLIPVLLLVLLLVCIPWRYTLSMDWTRQTELISKGNYTAIAAGLLLLFPQRVIHVLQNKRFAAGFLLLFLCFALHIPGSAKYGTEAVLQPFLYLILPLTACCFAGEFRKILYPFLAAVWILIALTSLWGLFFHSVPLKYFLGIPGNLNWNGSLFLASLPALMYGTYRTGKRFLPPKAAFFLPGVPLLLFLFLMKYFHSAGMILSFAVMVFVSILFLLPGKIRKYVLLFCFLAGTAGGTFLILNRERLSADLLLAGSAHERIGIGKAACRAIMERPYCGWSFCKAESALSTRRSEDYFKSSNPAVRTDHPHDHILYFTLASGLPAALLWTVFFLLFPFCFTFRKLTEEKGECRKKILFLALTVFLVHGQIDLIMDVWPTGFLALFLLGLCWQETFHPLTEQEHRQKTPKYLFLTAAILLLLTAGILTIRNGWLLIRKETLFHAEDLPESERKKLTNELVRLFPEKYSLLYDLMLFAMQRKDYEGALLISGSIRESAVPDYARLHMARGQAFIMTGKPEEALTEYAKDAELFPLAVLPVFNMYQIAGKTGRPQALPLLKKELERRIRELRITEEEFHAVLQKPEYELTPWKAVREADSERNWKARFQKR